MSMTADDVLAPRRPQRLNSRDIEALATLDPTTGIGQGQLRALRRRCADPTDPALPLIEALEGVAAAARPGDPTPAYVNPARVSTVPAAAGDKRPLTASDIEWLKRLPTDPAKVAADDVAALAGMVRQAASQADLRLLKAHFEPIWAHHDVLEQQHQRRAERQAAEAKKGVRSRTIEQLAVAALTPLIQQQIPELRDHEARNRAADHLRDRWADADLELHAQITASSEAPTPRPMPGIEGLSEMAAGRERGERARAERAAAPSPFEGMPLIGDGAPIAPRPLPGATVSLREDHSQ